MSTLTKRGVECDAYIIVSQTKHFGHIIEGNVNNAYRNIFDIYDIPLSELEYIKREMLLCGNAFAALTQSGNVLVFSRLQRSSYIMGVLCVSLECMKYITSVFECVNTSPTLIRRLRRCHADREYWNITNLLSLYFYRGACDDFSGEFIYKSILEYSSVYNLNVRINRAIVSGNSPVGAVMCTDMLYVFLHFMFIVAARCDVEVIDIGLSEIADRVIVNSEMNINSWDLYTQRLYELERIADALSVSLKYRLEGSNLKISLCPYFIDDSQHGLKSKIQFDFLN